MISLSTKHFHNWIRLETNSFRFHGGGHRGIELDWAVGVDSERVPYVVADFGSWRKIERWDHRDCLRVSIGGESCLRDRVIQAGQGIESGAY